MRKVSFKSIMLALGALSLVVVGCKKDEVKPTDDHDHNDGELITTLELKFLNKDTTFVVTYDDPDGFGGKAPIKFDQINLLKNTDYSVEITLLDKTKTPYDTISNEVLEEADDHLFFYSSTPVDLFEYIKIEDILFLFQKKLVKYIKKKNKPNLHDYFIGIIYI